MHDDFGDLPDCIHAVSGFGESRRLALGSLFCSTFKPSNYSYVHSSGKMGFSDLPDCIHAVSGFSESRRLALGSLFCSTFKPSNYSYVHSSGKMGFSAHLRGMAGMLKFGDLSEGDITTAYDRESVLRAFRWLRHNKPLYQK